MTLELTLTDIAGGGKPFAGAAVYVWHCTREGEYSLYSPNVQNENFLRGVQVADAAGLVRFTSVFPGCYSGRWPHVHFEVYADQAGIADAGSAIATSQVALPKAACDQVYAQSGYQASVANLARLSLADDNVFGDDGGARQLATTTGDPGAGFTVALAVPVDTTTAPSAGGGPGVVPRPERPADEQCRPVAGVAIVRLWAVCQNHPVAGIRRRTPSKTSCTPCSRTTPRNRPHSAPAATAPPRPAARPAPAGRSRPPRRRRRAGRLAAPALAVAALVTAGLAGGQIVTATPAAHPRRGPAAVRHPPPPADRRAASPPHRRAGGAAGRRRLRQAHRAGGRLAAGREQALPLRRPDGDPRPPEGRHPHHARHAHADQPHRRPAVDPRLAAGGDRRRCPRRARGVARRACSAACPTGRSTRAGRSGSSWRSGCRSTPCRCASPPSATRRPAPCSQAPCSQRRTR